MKILQLVTMLMLSAACMTIAAAHAMPQGEVAAPKAMAPAPDVNLKPKQWQKVLDAYERIGRSLVNDNVKGVGAAADIIVENAPNGVVRRGAERVRNAAAGKDALKDTREQFKGLSKAVIDYTGGNYAMLAKELPAGRIPRQAYCPMADASWLQRGNTIANPYYGSGMPTCGKFQSWDVEK